MSLLGKSTEAESKLVLPREWVSKKCRLKGNWVKDLFQMVRRSRDGKKGRKCEKNEDVLFVCTNSP